MHIRIVLRIILRVVSLIMLAAAVVYIWVCLHAPTMGHTMYICGHKFDAEQWKICYAIYLIIMLMLFVSSFLIRKKTE